MGRCLLCFLLCSGFISLFAEFQVAAQDLVKPETAQTSDKKLDSTMLLPASTKLWVSIPNLKQLEKKFDQTQVGQLAHEEAIKPFFESLKEQGKDWLEQKNIRLGIQLEDLSEVQSGEICLAGVLQDLAGVRPARGSHGLVLLVDVGESEKEARELLAKLNAKLMKQKDADQEDIEINGIKVLKTTIKHPKRIRHSQVSFQAVANGWLLAADNEEIFRDIILRLAKHDTDNVEGTLASLNAFDEIMTRTTIEDYSAEIGWFVDPFGYIKLAQAIEQEESEKRAHQDEWADTLEEQGFDAIRGIGGKVSLLTGTHEVLHRAYIYAPKENLKKNQQRIFDLFDFSSTKNGPPQPPSWVPADAAGYFSGNWDFTKLLNSVGHIYDAFLSEGEFQQMVDDFKRDPDMQLDIPKLVGTFKNQITIISTAERPITESSERVVIGLRIGDDADFVYQSIKRAVGQGNGEEIRLGGIKVIEVDTTKEPEFELDNELAVLEGLDVGNEKEPVKEEREFELFEKRYFAVQDGYLLIANDKNYFKRILNIAPEVKLHDTEDYIQIAESLDQLTDASKVGFRQFGRMDRDLETNYEMLRKGNMGNSKTVMARVLNKIFETEDTAQPGKKEERKQKLDGSKLPENYAESIAPFLGPTGWVLENEAYGWRITSCILKKKPVSEVVQKIGETEKTENAHR